MTIWVSWFKTLLHIVVILEVRGPFFYQISNTLYTVALLGLIISNNALVSRIGNPDFNNKMIYKIDLQKKNFT